MFRQPPGRRQPSNRPAAYELLSIFPDMKRLALLLLLLGAAVARADTFIVPITVESRIMQFDEFCRPAA